MSGQLPYCPYGSPVLDGQSPSPTYDITDYQCDEDTEHNHAAQPCQAPQFDSLHFGEGDAGPLAPSNAEIASSSGFGQTFPDDDSDGQHPTTVVPGEYLQRPPANAGNPAAQAPSHQQAWGSSLVGFPNELDSSPPRQQHHGNEQCPAPLGPETSYHGSRPTESAPDLRCANTSAALRARYSCRETVSDEDFRRFLESGLRVRFLCDNCRWWMECHRCFRNLKAEADTLCPTCIDKEQTRRSAED